MVAAKSIYDFKIEALSGNQAIDFAAFKGKKILIVNTASECGFTPQYSQLQELYDQYKNKNFVLVGIPSNDFGAQEPGSEEEVAAFCTKNFGVTFPMTKKLVVKGSDAHPIYHWLTEKSLNGFADSEVKWNFQKYLVDESGHLIKEIAPSTEPLSDEVLTAIEK